MRFSLIGFWIAVSMVLFTGAGQAGALSAYEAYSSNGEQNAYEWCYRSSLSSAKSCARDACEETGGEECASAEYCSPSQWTGVMTMKRTDGTIVHALVCERPSRPSIFVAVRKKCVAFRKDDPGSFKGCDVLTVISPDGSATDNSTHYRWRDGGLQAY